MLSIVCDVCPTKPKVSSYIEWQKHLFSLQHQSNSRKLKDNDVLVESKFESFVVENLPCDFEGNEGNVWYERLFWYFSRFSILQDMLIDQVQRKCIIQAEDSKSVEYIVNQDHTLPHTQQKLELRSLIDKDELRNIIGNKLISVDENGVKTMRKIDECIIEQLERFQMKDFDEELKVIGETFSSPIVSDQLEKQVKFYDKLHDAWKKKAGAGLLLLTRGSLPVGFTLYRCNLAVACLLPQSIDFANAEDEMMLLHDAYHQLTSAVGGDIKVSSLTSSTSNSNLHRNYNIKNGIYPELALHCDSVIEHFKMSCSLTVSCRRVEYYAKMSWEMLLHFYSTCFPSFIPYIGILEFWHLKAGISTKMSILVNLAVFLLIKDGMLPSPHELQKIDHKKYFDGQNHDIGFCSEFPHKDLKSNTESSLAKGCYRELLENFLKFLIELDVESNVISLREGRLIPKAEFWPTNDTQSYEFGNCPWNDCTFDVFPYMCMQHPFLPTWNMTYFSHMTEKIWLKLTDSAKASLEIFSRIKAIQPSKEHKSVFLNFDFSPSISSIPPTVPKLKFNKFQREFLMSPTFSQTYFKYFRTPSRVHKSIQQILWLMFFKEFISKALEAMYISVHALESVKCNKQFLEVIEFWDQLNTDSLNQAVIDNVKNEDSCRQPPAKRSKPSLDKTDKLEEILKNIPLHSYMFSHMICLKPNKCFWQFRQRSEEQVMYEEKLKKRYMDPIQLITKISDKVLELVDEKERDVNFSLHARIEGRFWIDRNQGVHGRLVVPEYLTAGKVKNVLESMASVIEKNVNRYAEFRLQTLLHRYNPCIIPSWK